LSSCLQERLLLEDGKKEDGEEVSSLNEERKRRLDEPEEA